MGHLDRAKALMKDADLEVKTGIDCVRSVVSVKTLPETKPLIEHYRFKYPDDLSNYPIAPCHNCGCGDYWLRGISQWGKAEWLCSLCHPQPPGAT